VTPRGGPGEQERRNGAKLSNEQVATHMKNRSKVRSWGGGVNHKSIATLVQFSTEKRLNLGGNVLGTTAGALVDK